MILGNSSIILFIFLSLFLGNAQISYAVIHIGAAHINGVHIGSDPCAGQSPGYQVPPYGVICAGSYNGYKYMILPSGCLDSSCTGAGGGVDSVHKAWANNSGTSAYNTNTGATSPDDGKTNTAILTTTIPLGSTNPPYYTDTDAAHWCSNMNYAGYTDWFLPAENEINFFYSNKATLGGFRLSTYWSSTENDLTTAWRFSFINANEQTASKQANTALASFVHCARKYP